MVRVRRFGLAALCAVGLALVCAGAGARAQTTPRTAIVVAPIASTDQVAVWYAQQQGWFDKAGLDVTIQQVPSGAAALTAVVGGAAQIGFTNPLALIEAHARGVPVLAVAPGTLYRPALPHAALLVAGNADFKTAKDLEGRVVAVAGLHDLLGVSVLLWLEKNGADPAKVKFVEMPPATMPAALDAKRIDAMAIYEPFLSSSLLGGAKLFAKPYDAIGPSFMTGAWVAGTAWVTDHRAAALAFNRVIVQADQYVNNHYDDLVPLIGQVTKLSPETLRTMVKMYTPPALSPASLQPVVDAAAKAHEIPAPFPAADLILSGVP